MNKFFIFLIVSGLTYGAIAHHSPSNTSISQKQYDVASKATKPEKKRKNA